MKNLMEKNIYDLIQEKMPSFSKGQKRICAYITEECEKAAFMTAANLGKTVGVSESTVVRFAMDLGYAGYPGMQNALRQTMLIRVKDSGRGLQNSGAYRNENFLSLLLRDESKNVCYSYEILDEKIFQSICVSVKNCRCMYFLGNRYTLPLAEYARNYMRLLHPNVQAISASNKRMLLEQCSFADSRDTVLIFGYPSHDEDIVFSAQYLQSIGVKTIVISDSKLSPLAQYGDFFLVAKTNKTTFIESMTAPMSLVHVILSILLEDDKENITKRMNRQS